MLLEILDILQITTTEFFCPTLQEDDLHLVNLIKSMSPDSKQTILDLMKKLK